MICSCFIKNYFLNKICKGSANSSSNEDKGLEPGPPKDEDPDGQKALAVSDPLEQAWKLLKPFLNQSSNSIEMWIIIYDVSIRRSKLYFL